MCRSNRTSSFADGEALRPVTPSAASRPALRRRPGERNGTHLTSRLQRRRMLAAAAGTVASLSGLSAIGLSAAQNTPSEARLPNPAASWTLEFFGPSERQRSIGSFRRKCSAPVSSRVALLSSSITSWRARRAGGRLVNAGSLGRRTPANRGCSGTFVYT